MSLTVRATVSINSNTVPSWVPSPGQFARMPANQVGNNAWDATPLSLYQKPGLGTGGSENTMSDAWTTWQRRVFIPQYGTAGAMLFWGSGHGPQYQPVTIFDVGTRTWTYAGCPTRTHAYTTTNNDLANHLNADHEYNDETGITTGTSSIYTPHTYGGVSYIPPSAGGGPQGSLLVLPIIDSALSSTAANSCVHAIDLSIQGGPSATNIGYSRYTASTVGPTFPGFSGGMYYAGTAYDDTRNGWWISHASLGQTRCPFLSATTRNFTFTASAPFVGSHAMNRYPDGDMLIQFIGNDAASNNSRGVIINDAMGWKCDGSHGNFAKLICTTQAQGPVGTLGQQGTFWPNFNGPNWSPLKKSFVYYDGASYYGGTSTNAMANCGYGPNRVFFFTAPTPGQEFTSPWVWSSQDFTAASVNDVIGPLYLGLFNSGEWGMHEIPSLSRPGQVTYMFMDRWDQPPLLFVTTAAP